MVSLVAITAFVSLSGCFKNLPVKNEVYFNDFEGGSVRNLSVYDHYGKVDTVKIVPFNHTKVFGFFNNNRFDLQVDNLPAHNAIKIEFDLLIHDKWDGDHLIQGTTVPDAWQMQLEGQPIYITTFSNGPYGQSFPHNYIAGNTSNPARANSWNADLPGVCALQSQVGGSTLYKIEYTTAHTAPSVLVACNDALQPYLSYCLKSWSVDNIRITAINYN